MQLRPSLAEADHDRRLGVDGRPRPAGAGSLTRVPLGPREHVERSIVPGSLSHRLLQPSHRFDVVIQDVRPGRHDRPERLFLAVEIGDQHLHAHAGAGLREPDGSSRRRRSRRRRQIVAGDARDHDVVEAQSADRLGNATRLVEVVDVGLPVLMAQNPQARVQVSPRIMTVAVRWSQHSPMLGQWASSQTVCKARPWSRRRRSW
jgi:hypothetical protein